MRVVTAEVLRALSAGWNLEFNKGFGGTETHWRKIAMETKSTNSETVYPFLGQLPKIREWIGERRIRQLGVHGFTIKNRKFEDTITVRREDIEDDNLGVYLPMLQEFGRETAEHPDRLVFELLEMGFTAPCYDGQNFFDTEHPTVSKIGGPGTVSNFQEGSGPAWFLFDTSRAIKPLIYQERIPLKLTAVTEDGDPHVFMTDQYLWGVRGRSAAGFGMWELAYASRAPLTPENYEAARATMNKLRGDEGKLLGVRPTVMVVPVDLEGDARRLLKAALLESGKSNIWNESLELVVTSHLDPDNLPYVAPIVANFAPIDGGEAPTDPAPIDGEA